MDFQRGCNQRELDACVDQLPLTMSYVPMQQWNQVYDLQTAFQRGTIFPELDKPFFGAGRDCPCHR